MKDFLQVIGILAAIVVLGIIMLAIQIIIHYLVMAIIGIVFVVGFIWFICQLFTDNSCKK